MNFVSTERGLINISAEFDSIDDAEEAGFTYSFHSSTLKRNLYGKTLDDRGLYHTFCLIKDEVAICPHCDKQVEKSDMLWVKDPYGIPFIKVCSTCYKLGYYKLGGQAYSEADECLDEDY